MSDDKRAPWEQPTDEQPNVTDPAQQPSTPTLGRPPAEPPTPNAEPAVPAQASERDAVSDEHSERVDNGEGEALTPTTIDTSTLDDSEALVTHPDLPPNHFFNRVTTFPVGAHDSKSTHRITPHNVKVIADLYSSGEYNPDTDRPRSLANCASTLGFHRSTYLDKVHSFPEVRGYHERAQRMRADILQDEMVREAENDDNDTFETVGMHDQPITKSNPSAVRRSELIVKSYNAVMGQMDRAKYAPETLVKSQHLHLHGRDDSNPLAAPMDLADVEHLSVEDILQRQSDIRGLPAP